MSRLFAFGLGFSAQALAAQLAARDWEIAGTARDVGRIGQLAERGYAVVQYAGEAENVALPEALRGTTHLLHSIPPGPEGDPVLAHYRDAIAALPGLKWIGYLSTVGVYGDQGGRWVDETAPPKPNSARTEARVEAEKETYLEELKEYIRIPSISTDPDYKGEVLRASEFLEGKLRAAGLTFRSDVITGPGGSQIVLDDPAGNPIELFQPAS